MYTRSSPSASVPRRRTSGSRRRSRSRQSKEGGDEEVLEVANRATAPLYIVHPIKKFEERSKSIFDTHPPLNDRIRRLVSLTQ